MAFNVHAERGKGLRKCPALAGWIDTQTCGQHRLDEIRCPATCTYLKRHQRYEREREAAEFYETWLEKIVPLIRHNRPEALDLLLALTCDLYRFLDENPSTQDGDLLEGIKFLRRQLSPVQVVELSGGPLEQHALNSLKTFQQQHPQIDSDEQARVIDCLLDIVATDVPQGRHKVYGLLGFLERHFGDALSKTPPSPDDIVVPTIVTPD